MSRPYPGVYNFGFDRNRTYQNCTVDRLYQRIDDNNPANAIRWVGYNYANTGQPSFDQIVPNSISVNRSSPRNIFRTTPPTNATRPDHLIVESIRRIRYTGDDNLFDNRVPMYLIGVSKIGQNRNTRTDDPPIYMYCQIVLQEPPSDMTIQNDPGFKHDSSGRGTNLMPSNGSINHQSPNRNIFYGVRILSHNPVKNKILSHPKHEIDSLADESSIIPLADGAAASLHLDTVFAASTEVHFHRNYIYGNQISAKPRLAIEGCIYGRPNSGHITLLFPWCILDVLGRLDNSLAPEHRLSHRDGDADVWFENKRVVSREFTLPQHITSKTNIDPYRSEIWSYLKPRVYMSADDWGPDLMSIYTRDRPAVDMMYVHRVRRLWSRRLDHWVNERPHYIVEYSVVDNGVPPPSNINRIASAQRFRTIMTYNLEHVYSGNTNPKINGSRSIKFDHPFDRDDRLPYAMFNFSAGSFLTLNKRTGGRYRFNSCTNYPTDHDPNHNIIMTTELTDEFVNNIATNQNDRFVLEDWVETEPARGFDNVCTIRIGMQFRSVQCIMFRAKRPNTGVSTADNNPTNVSLHRKIDYVGRYINMGFPVIRTKNNRRMIIKNSRGIGYYLELKDEFNESYYPFVDESRDASSKRLVVIDPKNMTKAIQSFIAANPNNYIEDNYRNDMIIPDGVTGRSQNAICVCGHAGHHYLWFNDFSKDGDQLYGWDGQVMGAKWFRPPIPQFASSKISNYHIDPNVNVMTLKSWALCTSNQIYPNGIAIALGNGERERTRMVKRGGIDYAYTGRGHSEIGSKFDSFPLYSMGFDEQDQVERYFGVSVKDYGRRDATQPMASVYGLNLFYMYTPSTMQNSVGWAERFFVVDEDYLSTISTFVFTKRRTITRDGDTFPLDMSEYDNSFGEWVIWRGLKSLEMDVSKPKYFGKSIAKTFALHSNLLPDITYPTKSNYQKEHYLLSWFDNRLHKFHFTPDVSRTLSSVIARIEPMTLNAQNLVKNVYHPYSNHRVIRTATLDGVEYYFYPHAYYNYGQKIQYSEVIHPSVNFQVNSSNHDRSYIRTPEWISGDPHSIINERVSIRPTSFRYITAINTIDDTRHGSNDIFLVKTMYYTPRDHYGNTGINYYGVVTFNGIPEYGLTGTYHAVVAIPDVTYANSFTTENRSVATSPYPIPIYYTEYSYSSLTSKEYNKLDHNLKNFKIGYLQLFSDFEFDRIKRHFGIGLSQEIPLVDDRTFSGSQNGYTNVIGRPLDNSVREKIDAHIKATGRIDIGPLMSRVSDNYPSTNPGDLLRVYGNVTIEKSHRKPFGRNEGRHQFETSSGYGLFKLADNVGTDMIPILRDGAIKWSFPFVKKFSISGPYSDRIKRYFENYNGTPHDDRILAALRRVNDLYFSLPNAATSADGVVNRKNYFGAVSMRHNELGFRMLHDFDINNRKLSGAPRVEMSLNGLPVEFALIPYINPTLYDECQNGLTASDYYSKISGHHVGLPEMNDRIPYDRVNYCDMILYRDVSPNIYSTPNVRVDNPFSQLIYTQISQSIFATPLTYSGTFRWIQNSRLRDINEWTRDGIDYSDFFPAPWDRKSAIVNSSVMTPTRVYNGSGGITNQPAIPTYLNTTNAIEPKSHALSYINYVGATGDTIRLNAPYSVPVLVRVAQNSIVHNGEYSWSGLNIGRIGRDSFGPTAGGSFGSDDKFVIFDKETTRRWIDLNLENEYDIAQWKQGDPVSVMPLGEKLHGKFFKFDMKPGTYVNDTLNPGGDRTSVVRVSVPGYYELWFGEGDYIIANLGMQDDSKFNFVEFDSHVRDSIVVCIIHPKARFIIDGKFAVGNRDIHYLVQNPANEPTTNQAWLIPYGPFSLKNNFFTRKRTPEAEIVQFEPRHHSQVNEDNPYIIQHGNTKRFYDDFYIPE